MAYSQEALESAHQHCKRNRRAIEQSKICGCFYCCETYAPSEISAWIEDDWNDGPPREPTERWTARCARCDIDSVIGDASGLPVGEPDFLHAMRQHWFE
jgi:hypothetical protein